MGGPRETRFPFGPLAAVLRREAHASGREYGMSYIADRLGVENRQAWQWQKDGMTLRMADRAACRIGFHPAVIWQDLYWTWTQYPDDEEEDE